MRKEASRKRVVCFVLVSMLVGASMARAVDTYVEGPEVRKGSTVREGDKQVVRNNGKAQGTIVEQYGEQIVYDQSVAQGTIVERGGVQRLYNQSIAQGTIVERGGVQSLYDRSVAQGTTVREYGQQVISYSGLAEGTIVEDRGSQYVSEMSRAEGTIVRNGGVQNVSGNGKAIVTIVRNGGRQSVSDTGLARGTIVEQGGEQVVIESGRSEGTSNYGRVVIRANAADYIGHSGSMLEVIGSATLEGRTVLEREARVRLSSPVGNISKLTMKGEVNCEEGGVIEIEVDSWTKIGCVILEGAFTGVVRLVIKVKDSLMGEDEPAETVVDDGTQMRRSGRVPASVTGDENEGEDGATRRVRVVKFNGGHIDVGDGFVLDGESMLPPGSVLRRDRDGYDLLITRKRLD